MAVDLILLPGLEHPALAIHLAKEGMAHRLGQFRKPWHRIAGKRQIGEVGRQRSRVERDSGIGENQELGAELVLARLDARDRLAQVGKRDGLVLVAPQEIGGHGAVCGVLIERQQVGDQEQAFFRESDIVAFRVGKPQASERFDDKSHFNL